MATNASDRQNAGAPPANRTRVPVDGGVLVYEPRDLGKELVGFEDVTNADRLADALAARGHDRGAAYHKPILDAEA